MGRQMETLSSLVTITAETQAIRVQALIQLSDNSDEGPLTYKKVEEAMAAMNIPLSRSTWHKLTSIKDKVPNFKILTGLATFFGVPNEYMTDESAEDPEQVVAQMGLLHTMKVESVIDFAARKLGGMNPADYDVLRSVLSAHGAGRQTMMG